MGRALRQLRRPPWSGRMLDAEYELARSVSTGVSLLKGDLSLSFFKNPINRFIFNDLLLVTLGTILGQTGVSFLSARKRRTISSSPAEGKRNGSSPKSSRYGAYAVRVWGVDAHSLPFTQLVTVKNPQRQRSSSARIASPGESGGVPGGAGRRREGTISRGLGGQAVAAGARGRPACNPCPQNHRFGA